jgi:predicted RNA methylase
MEKKFARGGNLEPHKEVSASVKGALSDVLAQEKYSIIKPMQAQMLYNKFKDYKDFEVDKDSGLPVLRESLSDMEIAMFKDLEEKHGYISDLDYVGAFFETRGLTKLEQKGQDFIDAINTRLQTRRAVKAGTDLFPNESAIPELVSSEIEPIEDDELDVQSEQETQESQSFLETYRPVFWHLTKQEFCQYAEKYSGKDKRIEGIKSPEDCHKFYVYHVIKPMLHETAERNLFLLAVETGQLPYDKAEMIIRSAGAWDESNRYVKQLIENYRLKNGPAQFWLVPKDIYLESDYFKNNFSKSGANKWYKANIFNRFLLSESAVVELVKKGIVKHKHIVARMSEAGYTPEELEKHTYVLNKVKGISDKTQAKLKLKKVAILLQKENQPTPNKNSQLLPPKERQFSEELYYDTKSGVKHNKTSLEKAAKKYGITEPNLVKEIAELTIYGLAREIATNSNLSEEKQYDEIVELYKSQVNLSHRTSESILMQQYSTPAPIGFLAGLFCKFDKQGLYFEPSAGNGLLTVAGSPSNFIVNELDNTRNRNLKTIGFKEVLKQDATLPFTGFEKKFDAVITNPPFGSTEVVKYGNTDIKSLEQLMALRAIDCMKDAGRAAIIVGGHQTFDKEGRIQAGKNRTFFVYLYKHYNVVDVINIDGHALYSRQGTAFNTRLILINGRKETPAGFPPLIEKPIPNTEINSYTPVSDFNTLWERVSLHF